MVLGRIVSDRVTRRFRVLKGAHWLQSENGWGQEDCAGTYTLAEVNRAIDGLDWQHVLICPVDDDAKPTGGEQLPLIP